MKVFVMSSFVPTKSQPLAGLFVSKRLEQMRNIGIHFKVVLFYFIDSFSIRFIKRILHRSWIDPKQILDESNGILYEKGGIKRSMLSLVTSMLNERYFCDKYLRKTSEFSVVREFDLTLLHGLSSILYGNIAYMLSKRFNKPFVVVLHGSDVNVLMRKKKEKYKPILENAHKVIFVSNALLNTAKSFGYSGKMQWQYQMGMIQVFFILLIRSK